MVATGVGSTFSEAMEDYLQKSEMCDTRLSHDVRDSLESSTNFSPLYVGVNVKHTLNETLDYIKLFNNVNREYLSLFRPFLKNPEFSTQIFTNTNNKKNNTKHKESNTTNEFDNQLLYQDYQVAVLGKADSIVLQDHFHVTLFFLGVDKKTEEMVKEDVDKVSKYLKGKDPGFEQMLNTLTLYEFSICLMYRHLYKMQLPFETPYLPEELPENEEIMTMRYLVLVPGVVFFSIVELQKPLFAVPPKDFDSFGHKHNLGLDSVNNQYQYSVEELVKNLKKTVLIENFHSTHITLGTSKEYKAVISNQICQSLLHFLETNTYNNVHSYSSLKLDQNTPQNPDFKDELNKHLKVFNSGPCKYGNLKDIFLKSVPYLLDNFNNNDRNTYGNNNANNNKDNNKNGCRSDKDDYDYDTLYLKDSSNSYYTSLSTHKSHDLSSKDNSLFNKVRNFLKGDEKDLYQNTTLYVSDDFKWFYFNNLPATHTLHSDASKECYDWNVDVYVLSMDKNVSGNIHFNQK